MGVYVLYAVNYRCSTLQLDQAFFKLSVNERPGLETKLHLAFLAAAIIYGTFGILFSNDQGRSFPTFCKFRLDEAIDLAK